MSDEKARHMKSDGGSTPRQYSIPSDAKELQDLIEYRNMNFAIGNIFKACYRMGLKEGADELYDLNKIIFFAEREKERIKRLKKKEEDQCEFRYQGPEEDPESAFVSQIIRRDCEEEI